jgi:hypothetical protein
VAELSEWLQIMLAEIARKREEAQHAAAEEQLRARTTADAAPGAAPGAARASISAL